MQTSGRKRSKLYRQLTLKRSSTFDAFNSCRALTHSSLVDWFDASSTKRKSVADCICSRFFMASVLAHVLVIDNLNWRWGHACNAQSTG
jgi:hypothetical protein